ncbi:MAG TPA: CDGSH iron-sulfur domain-containing protein [Alphaproteobacteria bacterium]|jgi:CDGSH-type Zn-finger protein|nr:glutamate synthase [Dehalococcoidales bacterium]MDP6068666.1 CDGSH iron-sulfur domain-containing protein [Alphaproteobacteria bacterium]MDP6268767.1 CDGSH iron-sulfur domain-containing protein [Alphaproteobacteria bacterium]MDP7427469.1 CDGSH iron-sulfur domain-containing protein [Alphaproteobacteria bacterium]HJM49877.1 CDGSH iron-sulfur domain-containing protein [Alphaproteobacteria bacterium]
MDEVVVAQKSPYATDVTAGEKYYWCTCGRSSKQPLCDGTHKETSFTPLAWEAPETKTVYFCGCKKTGKSPLCDGSHKDL